MKRFLIMATWLVAVSAHFTHAQSDESGQSYYVVIGAFQNEKNATDFIAHWAVKHGLTPQYKMNENRKLFYVYTMQDKHWGIPVQEAERTRKLNPKFDHTWVYYGNLHAVVPAMTVRSIPSVETEPVAVSQSRLVLIDSLPENESTPEPVVKKFNFNLRAEDGAVLKAPVELVDLDNANLAALYPSNESVVIQPINESGRVMVQSKIFGYRLKQVALNLNNPSDSANITINEGVFNVPLILKPLVVGDITIMYNVFFFKDAGIMRPDSKFEVNSLVTMMQEIPNRKIVIHGHTNGNHREKILRMGADKNFFSTDNCIMSMGSAVDLSLERAKCIQEYLIANGISKDRMTIKAWGGKKMLYPEDSPRAIDNVRVEVEIVKD